MGMIDARYKANKTWGLPRDFLSLKTMWSEVVMFTNYSINLDYLREIHTTSEIQYNFDYYKITYGKSLDWSVGMWKILEIYI